MKHSLFIILLLALSCSYTAAQNDQKLTRAIFKELIEINTTQSGSTTKAAEAMAARLREAGFAEQDIFLGGPTEKRGNLVATLRGKGKQKPILLLAHLDVVEALRTDWTTNPFTFEETDDYYYGRGTTDDKAMVAIFVSNLIRMKKEGIAPDRNIILALTADEEEGNYNGVDWLLKNHPELIDADFALNEGGGGEIRNGKRTLNRIQVAEKIFQSFNVEVKNRGGHSSQPRKDNAIYQLAQALTNLSHYEFPIHLNEGTRAFFERSAKIESGQAAEDMLGVIQVPPRAESVARLSEVALYNALLRTTCVATMVNGGHAENALPQSAGALINCRIQPGEDPENIKQLLLQALNEHSLTLTPVKPARPSQPSPLSPDIVGPVEKITQEMWPGVPVVPFMSTGATDGSYLRIAGIPTYGVSGLFSDIADNRMHGKDERIKVSAFYEGQEFLYRLVKEFTTPMTIKGATRH